MAKLTLSDVTNFTTSSAATTVNSNSAALEQAMEKTLYRDGTAPNQMEASLDMNSHRILNLPAAGSDGEPVRRSEFNTAVIEASDGTALLSNAVTNSIMADMPANTVKGRLSTGGDPQDIPIAELTARSYATYEDLIAESSASLSDGDVVQLSGYLEPGDRGGGLFVWNNSSTATADGGYIVALSGGGTGRFIRVRQEEFRPEMFGCVGDGDADDTEAFNSAVQGAAAARIPLVLGPGPYRLTDFILIEDPVVIKGVKGLGQSTIIGDIGLGANFSGTQTHLFRIESDDVQLKDFTITAEGLTHTPTLYNHYGIAIGESATTRKNILIEGIKFKDWLYGDGLTFTSNLITSHAVYIVFGENVIVRNCNFEGVAGSGTVVYTGTNITIDNNIYRDVVWYPINLDYSADNVLIENNVINSTTGTFWGAAINVQSQPPGIMKNIYVRRNKISGFFGYGQGIRVLSTNNAVVSDNVISNWDILPGTPISPTGLFGILVVARGVFGTQMNNPGGISSTYTGNITVTTIPGGIVSGTYPIQIEQETMTGTIIDATTINITARGQAGSTAAAHADGTWLGNRGTPPANILIANNYIESPITPKDNHGGIYVGTQWWPEGNPSHMITIKNNYIVQNGGTATPWQTGIVVNGQDGGVNEVNITGNRIQTGITGVSGHFGALSVVGSTTGAVSFVTVNDNFISDLGDGTNFRQVGIYLDYVVGANIGHNFIDNMHTGVFLSTNVTGKLLNVFDQNITRQGDGAECVSIATGTILSDSRVYTATTTQLNGIGDEINVFGKYVGKRVYNVTSGKTVTASGSSAASAWLDSEGAAEYTPS